MTGEHNWPHFDGIENGPQKGLGSITGRTPKRMRTGLKNDWLQILAATSVWRLEEMSLKMNLGMGLKMHIGRKMHVFQLTDTLELIA
jgi:hypothetical protein